MNILIVEDDEIIAENLNQILVSIGYTNLMTAFEKEAAISLLNSNSYDLALLDINLKDKNEGLDIACFISENYRIPIVFITATTDKIIIDKAVSFKPVGYITKPFKESDIYSQMKIVENTVITTSPSKLKILHKNYTAYIDFSEIRYLKSANVHVEIVTTEKKYLERTNMSEMMKKLPANFVKVHRSYVVNINYIESILNGVLILKSDKIPFSGNYKAELFQKLSN